MEKIKILIVEDEVAIALEIESELLSLGYVVTSIVNSSQKAIDKAETDQPDLILMDIRIKGEMDGIDTAEVIRKKYEIPVIFITAYLDDKRISQAKITMPFGYLLKPIRESDLKVAIEMALYMSQIDRERKKAEKELRLTKYSIDNSSTAALWVKQDARIRYANKAASQLTGYSHQELLEMKIIDLDPSVSIDIFNEAWRELEAKGTSAFESVFAGKDGREFPIEITGNLQIFEDEKYFFANVSNISERREAELERTRLVSAIEQSSDNIIITSVEGSIEYVNPAFERNTGYSRKEVKGENPRILKSGVHSDDFYRNIWETITNGEIWTGNITNKHRFSHE